VGNRLKNNSLLHIQL